jgi:probable rRNA maturation factor
MPIPEPIVELTIEAGDWPPEAELSRIAEAAAMATASAVPGFPAGRTVSILLTDDARIAALNALWRGKEGPTNVLSFPAPPAPLGAEGELPLGDIVLGCETVTKEAAASHLTLTDHISHLLVHGLLHLVGYDHGDDREAEAMEALETRVLAELGVADPYAGSEPELISNAGSNGR